MSTGLAGVPAAGTERSTETSAEPLIEPMWVAHRGGDKICPENTRKGFNCGLNHGADALEMDIRLTANDKLALMHDARLDRATDCTGYVADYLAADFLHCNVDVECLLACENPTSTTLFRPVVLDFAPRTTLFIEAMSRAAATKVMHRLETEQQDGVFFTANQATAADAIERGYRVVAKAPFGLAPEEMAAQGYWGLAIPKDSSDARVIRMHNAGLLAFVNHIRTQADVAESPEGVDGYITTDPRLGE